MAIWVLQGPGLSSRQAQDIAERVGGDLEKVGQGYYRVHAEQSADASELAALRALGQFDVNVLPAGFEPAQVGLLISDMDSTLITIECVDEIADHLGIKPQVSAVTEAAMRGEIDFKTSLIQRVGLLANAHKDALAEVYEQRLALSPGAEALIAGLKAQGIKIALVSGGFTFFTDRLRDRLGLDYTLANVLDIENDRLTGQVLGEVIGAEAKAALLERLQTELGLNQAQTVAIGDGANDLPMLRRAGLSVAYHAKPKVQAEAAAVLNHCGLEGVLGLLNLPVPEQPQPA